MRSRGTLLAAFVLAVPALAGRANAPEDPLATELARLEKHVREKKAADESWTQLKAAVTPALERAEEALKAGRRLYALQRTGAALVNLSASAYVDARPAAERKETAGFEAEWAKAGRDLEADLKAPPPDALAGMSPAAVRAIGESALPQVRNYYEASLEYGRNTMPDSGLFYIGLAKAQRELLALCRSVSRATALRPPPVRRIDSELDALQGELLAAYRPPASIERHVDFIVANSALKEARELNETGLLHGALLRYLQAAARVGVLRTPARTVDGDALAAKLKALEARLTGGDLDQSIGRYFLEAAATEGPSPNAAAIVDDVLPRYFAALEPARPAPPKPRPEVAVTLVRWPYT